MAISKSTKGQIYWIDYSIALFLFISMLSLFLVSLDNLTSKNELSFNDVKKQSDFISQTLLQEGIPKNWISTNFSKIGLKNGHIISKLKIYEFEALNYSQQKNSMRLIHPFDVIFTNGSGKIQNMGGLCSLGAINNLTENNYLAYYSGRSFTNSVYENVSLLKGKTFNSSTVDAFFNELGNFSLVIIDNPNFKDEGSFTFAEKKAKLGTFVQSGNNLIFSGYFGGDVFGVHFNNFSGVNFTILSTDNAFPFFRDQKFHGYYNYFLNGSITKIGINQNEEAVLAKWKFGNGTIYYFANFTFDYYGKTMSKDVVNCIKYNIKGSCKDFDFSGISADALVKTERFCIVDNKLLTMGVYSWE